MLNITQSKIMIGLVVSVLGAALVFLSPFGIGHSLSSASDNASSLNTEWLAEDGIVVKPIPVATGVIPQSAAEAAANARYPGPIASATLVNYTGPGEPPTALVWAISMPDSGMPSLQGPGSGQPPLPAFQPSQKWWVVFIDAKTGAFVMGDGGVRANPAD